MKLAKVPSLFLALAIQLTPLASRIANVTPSLAASPFAIVLKWITGAMAAAGAMHAVSAASLPVTLLSANPVKGTVGVKLSPDYTIKLAENFNPPIVRPVGAWDLNGIQVVATTSLKRASNGVPAGVVFPPGLALVLATGIVTGTPTEAGNWAIDIRAWEHSKRSGASTSFSLNFNIASGVTAPVITSQPVAASASVGGTASFTVAATGTSLTYKWFKDDVLLNTATLATLSINPVKLADDGFYKSVISSGSLSVTTAPVRLTVTLPTTITGQPQPKSVHVGEFVVFNVLATGEGTLKYAWKRGDTVLLGQTGPSLLLNVVAAGDAGDYIATVTGNSGSVNSNPAKLTVVDAPKATASLQGANAVLHFGAIVGRTYSVEETDSLVAQPVWKSVGTVSPNSVDGTFSAPAPATSKFWRVKVE